MSKADTEIPVPAPFRRDGTKGTSTGKLAAFDQWIIDENANWSAVQALGALAPLPSAPPQALCTVGLIASADTREAFANNCLTIGLDNAEWVSQFERSRPDFVLVESDLLDCTSAWRCEMLSMRPERNEIGALVDHCRRHGVPCALWFTLDRTHIRLCRHLIEDFDTVFVAEPDAFDVLLAEFGPVKIHRLAPYFEPRIFNPAKPNGKDIRRFIVELPVAADCLAATMFHDPDHMLLDTLEQCLDYKLCLYESVDYVRPARSLLPLHILRRSWGTVPRVVHTNILKLSEISLCLRPAANASYWQHQCKALQAMACKSLVLSNAAIDASVFGHTLAALFASYQHLSSITSARGVLTRLLRDKRIRERLQHLYYRHVMTQDTTRARIAQIAAAFGLASIAASARHQPSVTAIVPTIRPQNMDYVLQLYRAQTYPNRDLIIVLNTDASSPDAIRRKLREDDNARVIAVPPRWPIGVCMNTAIDEACGAYWAKLDDDDFYGPHYLADFVLNTLFLEFDIAGKASLFTYDEAVDQMTLRHAEGLVQAHMLARAFAGGSLFVRNSPSDRFRFPERTRGFADIYFQWHYLDAGCTLYASDHFNFVQVRRADRATHTWRTEMDGLGASERVANGLDPSVATI